MSTVEVSPPRPRSSSLKVSSGLLGLATIITRLTTLVLMALLARGAGAEAVGFYGVATLSASFTAAALSVGFPTYLTRSLPAGLVTPQEVARVHTIRFGALALATVVAYPITGFLVPATVQVGFVLFFVSSLLEQWNETAWVLIRGTRQAWREPLVNATTAALLLAMCGFDALMTDGLTFNHAAIYLVFASAVRSIGAFWMAGVWRPLVSPGKIDLFGRIKQSLPYFAADLLGLMYFRGDTLVLTLFVATAEVGQYVSATGIVGPAVQVASSMGVGALAFAASRGLVGGDRKDDPTTIFGFFEIAGFGATGAMLVGLPVAATILFGSEGATVQHLSMILALFLALRFGNFGLSALLLAGGKASSRLIVLVASIVGNVALNLALDKTFGPFGAAWSTVLTELIVAGSLLYFIRERTLYRPVAGSVVFVAIAAAVLVGLVAAAGITVASIGTGVLFLAGAAFLLLRRRSGRPVKTATVEAS